MLVGLLDSAQWQNATFDALMSKLPRGRADLFNLALGHVSRSFLIWAYMGMTVGSSVASIRASEPEYVQYATTTATNEQLYIKRDTSLQLEAARAEMLAAEQRLRDARNALDQLNQQALQEALQSSIRQKTPTPPQSVACSALPDVLSLSDGEDGDENENGSENKATVGIVDKLSSMLAMVTF